MQKEIAIQYDSSKFAAKLIERLSNKPLPKCPFCGGLKYTSTKVFATLPITDNFHSLALGPRIPAGLLICENCGHIEMFALGALSLLPPENTKGVSNEQK